jgi:prevent-host-death family protein
MKTISIRELHEKTGMLVREARRLGGLIVTERGAPVARLEPLAARPQVSPFRDRTLLPGYARLVRSGKLGRGAQSTRIVSEDRDGR